MALAAAFGQVGRSADGLKAAQEARGIAADLSDQEKLEALDKLIPVFKKAADEDEARMAAPAQDPEILVKVSLEACRYSAAKG